MKEPRVSMYERLPPTLSLSPISCEALRRIVLRLYVSFGPVTKPLLLLMPPERKKLRRSSPPETDRLLSAMCPVSNISPK
jgi:hypothetical protein